MANQVVALVLLALGANAVVLRGGDSDSMRPEMVANTLAKVEEEWRKEAAVFTEGSKSGASGAPDAFAHSCATVVSAVIQGSGGDRDVAKEYMNNVCGQKVLSGWHKQRCASLASRITEHAMLADNYANRQNLLPSKVCTSFWSVFVEAERTREADEAKEKAEHEKVVAEQEKKAAEAAAEEKKVADAAAKVEAERRAKVKAARDQEATELKAKQDAAEAKVRAAESAARLAMKKAEAEQVQREAQKKMKEAEVAEQEHKARQEEHEKAQEQLKNTVKSKPVEAPKEVAEAPKVAEVSAPKPAAKEVAAVVAKPAGKVEAAPAKADAKKPAVVVAVAAPAKVEAKADTKKK